MASSQLTAFYMSQARVVRAPDTKYPARRGRGVASGPVHRPGPTWYASEILQAEDPALALLAPRRPGTRMRRALRAAALLVGSLMMTPVLPVILA